MSPFTRPARRLPAVMGAAALAVTLAACGSGKTADTTATSASVSVSANSSLHDQLPASVKSKGELVMATDPSYPPIESVKSGGGYQGFDIDLANALAKVLGVKISIQKATFDGILAGINAGRFDFSMSAFTDNTDREKSNDFVDYFKAGTSIGVKKGNPKHVRSQLDLCGLKVGAERGTIQDFALTKKTYQGATTLLGQCLAHKKPAPVPVLLPDQSAVNAAVVSGRADAFIGDTPVVAYQGKLENGQIELAGQTTDVGPYGIAFPKNSPLVPVFQKAVQQLMDDGTYAKIIKTWGLQAGAISKATVDGAAG